MGTLMNVRLVRVLGLFFGGSSPLLVLELDQPTSSTGHRVVHSLRWSGMECTQPSPVQSSPVQSNICPAIISSLPSALLSFLFFFFPSPLSLSLSLMPSRSCRQFIRRVPRSPLFLYRKGLDSPPLLDREGRGEEKGLALLSARFSCGALTKAFSRGGIGVVIVVV